jgi:hypothetical protein
MVGREGKDYWQVGGRKTAAAVTSKHVPVYKSREEDRLWANSGMVATVSVGDSALSLQQRIEDAEFLHVVATPMGGTEFFSIVMTEGVFGTYLTKLCISLVCCFAKFIGGRNQMLSMNVELGCELTESPFMLGIIIFSGYV